MINKKVHEGTKREMFIVYTVNTTVEVPKIELLCYVQEYETGLDALDDYAIQRFKFKTQDFDTERNPLEDVTPPNKWKPGNYYLRMDPQVIGFDGESERINLFKVSEDGAPVLIRYFQVQKVGKYIDDFTRERTNAVIQLEKDLIDPDDLLSVPSSDDDEEEGAKDTKSEEDSDEF